MTLWDFFEESRQEYLERGDKERLRLTLFYSQAYDHRESDPHRAATLLTEAKKLAEALEEPWWALIYDKFRIDALIHFLRDFTQVLDLAVAAALELRKPAFAHFPDRFGVYDSLVAAYQGIDAEGYAEKIEEALDLLGREAPPESDNRHLYLARRRIFAQEREQWDRAYEACQEELAQCEAAADAGLALHFSVFVHCALCQVVHRLGRKEELAEQADLAYDASRRRGQQCELAEAEAWQAVAALQAGEREGAVRLRRRALARAERLGMPPKAGFFEALAAYHEQQGDVEGVLETRTRELEHVAGRGRWLYETRLRLRHARLLQDLARPDADDAWRRAEETARKLRKPEAFLEQVRRR